MNNSLEVCPIDPVSTDTRRVVSIYVSKICTLIAHIILSINKRALTTIVSQYIIVRAV